MEDPIHLKDVYFLNALKTKIADAVDQFGVDAATSAIGILHCDILYVSDYAYMMFGQGLDIKNLFLIVIF